MSNEEVNTTNENTTANPDALQAVNPDGEVPQDVQNEVTPSDVQHTDQVLPEDKSMTSEQYAPEDTQDEAPAPELSEEDKNI